MSNFKVHELWPTPIYENNIPVKSDWIDFAENCEYDRMFSQNGDYTSNKYILNSITDLKEELLFHVNLFAEKYLKVKNAKFYFLNSWIVKHNPNDFAQPHFHRNSLLSGVYYLNTDNQSGNICLHQPGGYTNLFHQSTKLPFDEVDNINCETWNVKPNNGDILLFPSHLVHSIEKNKSNIIRYALAFNLHIEAELYSKKSNIDYLKLRNGNRYEK